MPTQRRSRRSFGLAPALGLHAGCGDSTAPAIGRAAAALTVGAELTLLPNLPSSSAPVTALGHGATAALGDRGVSTGGVARAQVRLFNWEASAGDGGVVDGGTGDVVVVPPTDVGAADAGGSDAGVVTPVDVVVRDATASDVVSADVPAADVPAADDGSVPPIEDDGGCSVAGAPRGAPARGAPALLLALAALSVGRRRRALKNSGAPTGYHGRATELTRRPLYLTLTLTLTLMVVGCGDPLNPAPGPACVDGMSVACACVDGRTGAQVCLPEGRFGPCLCVQPDAATDSPIADVTAGDQGADAPLPDVGSSDVPTLDVPTLDVPTLDVPTLDVPTLDVPTLDVPTLDVPVSTVAAPRPLSPPTGSHVPSRRPTLRWALPAGVATARVTLCRDRALTASCVSFDATGTSGAPSADLASGIWFWALRGVVGGAAGAAGSVWRLRIATGAVAGARPWGSDPDFNGDGYADVVAAVPGVAASVFLGGPTGPSPTPVTLSAPLESTHFGRALDHAGDVNGDGYGDLVVGAPGSNSVYLYRGTATGVAPTPSAITGPVGSGLGSSVAGAGDVNGDGFDDVVAVNPSGNAVWFVPGGAAGLGMPVRVTVPLTSTTSVAAGAGDVDGDGYADVLLGGTTGGGQLLRGGATGLDAARAVAVANTSVPAGDLNGDGRADLAFLTRAGVRVVLGAATLDAAGTAAPGALSPSASMPPRGGDFNGDGFDDVLAGTRGDTLNRSAIVLPGSASGPGAAVTLAAGFGSATVHGAVGAGDVDGDGYDDLLSYQARTTDLYLTRGSASGLSFGRLSYVDLGVEPGYPNVSRAAVGDVDRDGHADYASGPSIYRGSSSGIVRATPWTLPGAFVSAVVAAGDVNRDGFPDVAALTSSGGFLDPARFSVFLGSSTGPGATAYSLGSALVSSLDTFDGLAGAGDFNGDGAADVLLSLGGTSLYAGRMPLTSPLAGVSLVGTGAYAAAGAGDVNGDGRADVAVAVGSSVRVIAGATTGAGTLLATIPGGLPAAVGDVNNDRFADLAVPGPSGVGIHLGSASGPATTPSLTLPRGNPIAAGDVNRDGRPDLILGALDEVRSGLFLGTAGGFATTPSLVFPEPLYLVRTPGAAGFGDVDGDGFGDVIIVAGFGVAVQRFDAPGARPRCSRSCAATAGAVYR
ncbi:MAG: VCBS repeat-containing protein [Deltaproteobacteria bacterium]|nr:VCBS repeat-containing protein [Deltaproteobacteria bacterium]